MGCRQTYKIVRRAVVVASDYLLSFNADAPGPGGLGSLNRAVPIKDIDKVSMSRFRDSYVAISVKDSYAYVCSECRGGVYECNAYCGFNGLSSEPATYPLFATFSSVLGYLLYLRAVAETKVSLVRALVNRYRALTGGGALPVEVGERLQYKAYKADGPEKARTIHFQQVPNAAVFESRVMEPWEAKLLQLPGGVGGGKTADATGEDTASSVVKEAYAKAEKFRAFHSLQGDRLSLVVSVPVPPKIHLKDLLSEAERTKLQAMGVKGVK